MTESLPALTQDTTEGYTDAELAELNRELAELLATIDPDDTDAREIAEKAFSDEIARR